MLRTHSLRLSETVRRSVDLRYVDFISVVGGVYSELRLCFLTRPSIAASVASAHNRSAATDINPVRSSPLEHLQHSSSRQSFLSTQWPVPGATNTH
jgi:hypothetical protein